MKKYFILIPAIITAVLMFLFWRRGEKIKDLIHEFTIKKIRLKLEETTAKELKQQQIYQEKRKVYKKLLEKFNENI